MNTVFKLYYQAWVLWSIASAFAVYTLLADSRQPTLSPVFRAVSAAVIVFAITPAMLYPALGVYYRTQIETGRAEGYNTNALTLDGIQTVGSPDDIAAVRCLAELVQGANVVVAERVGGSYDIGSPPTGLSGRVAGLQNVLNWPGHQGQWRGDTYGQTVGSRESDLDTLYTTQIWTTAQGIIDLYGIDYVFFGSAERDKYGDAAATKFADRLPVVCAFGGSRYYRVQPLQAE
jgi:uncharacterized membrane protein